MRHWLIKSEATVYPFARLQKDGRTCWDGVRNFEARNHLRAMGKGDLCLFYHSVDDKSVVGIAKVVKTAFPDPTAPGEDWAAVEVAPVKALARPVSLAKIRSTPALKGIPLLTRSRLSVTPLEPRHFELIRRLGEP
ncbi:MAG: EVE domain-containing protein [Deltaproteobacteria bacterium]